MEINQQGTVHRALDKTREPWHATWYKVNTHPDTNYCGNLYYQYGES